MLVSPGPGEMPRLDGFGAVHFMKPELITVEDCSCTKGFENVLTFCPEGDSVQAFSL